MTTTLTLTGSEAKLKQVLSFWEEINKETPAFGGLEFARGLTKHGRNVVRAICESSVADKPFHQDQLFDLLGLGDGNEVWGVMGGIGGQWAKTSSQPNPFIRKSDTASAPGYYQIDPGLAADLVAALDSVRQNVPLIYIQGEPFPPPEHSS